MASSRAVEAYTMRRYAFVFLTLRRLCITKYNSMGRLKNDSVNTSLSNVRYSDVVQIGNLSKKKKKIRRCLVLLRRLPRVHVHVQHTQTVKKQRREKFGEKREGRKDESKGGRYG